MDWAKASRNGVVRSTSAVVGVAAILGSVLFQHAAPAERIDATDGIAWLSGEQRGQIVLGSANSAAAGLAIQLGEGAQQFDVVSNRSYVAVQDLNSGTVHVLDSVKGTEVGTTEAPLPEPGRPTLVRAGDAVYLADSVDGTVRKLGGGGEFGPVRKVGSFSDWIGSPDGQLWVLDPKEGRLSSIGTVDSTEFLLGPQPEAVILARVGNDPVVLDASSNRLRWPTRGQSVVTPFDLSDAAIARQSGDADCLGILVESGVYCVAASGSIAHTKLDGKRIPPKPQIFISSRNYVIASPQDRAVLLATVGEDGWTQAQRREASGRALVESTVNGPLLIDDPGSRFGFTADEGQLVELDKFSEQTTVIGVDGELFGDATTGENGDDNESESESVVLGTDQTGGLSEVNGANLPPTLQPDAAVTRSGRPVAIDVLANDLDRNGDAVVLAAVGSITGTGSGIGSSIAGAGFGVAAIGGDQRVLYSPPEDFVGRVEFPYTATDLAGVAATSSVTVEVLDRIQNTAPQVLPDQAATPVNVAVAIPVLLNDTDAEGDELSITRVTQGTHGTVNVVDGIVRYSPTLEFSGTDSFAYTVDDGFGGQGEATVTIEVDGIARNNRAPVAVNDRATLVGTRMKNIDVLGNDFDPDNDTLQIVQVVAPSGIVATISASQSLEVTADAATLGPRQIRYTIQDPTGLTSTATLTVVVLALADNRAPIASDDLAQSSGGPINLSVLSNDVDPDDDPLTIVGFTQPESGSVVQLNASTLRFTPTSRQRGRVSFLYTIADLAGASSSATVVVEVGSPTGGSPNAVDDAVTSRGAKMVEITPLANDSDPDGLSLSLVGTPSASEGKVRVTGSTVQFTPPSGEPGVYRLSYVVANSAGKTARGRITVTVLEASDVNAAPTAADDRAETVPGATIRIAVLNNDSDPDGDTLDLQSVGAASHGSAVAAGKDVVFTAGPSFVGVASFSYVISDRNDHTATGLVIIQIRQRQRSAPVAEDDSAVSVGGAVVTVDVLSNDIDPDGPASEITILSVASQSPEVVAQATGRTVTLRPTKRPGKYEVNYTIRDADLLTATATIFLTVQPPANRPPIATADQVETAFEKAVTIPVLLNDIDPDGGPLTISSVESAGGGTAVVVGNQIRFTPSEKFSGSTQLQYVIADDGGLTDSAKVTIIVGACSAPVPVLTSDSFVTGYGVAKVVDLFANDSQSSGTFEVTTPSNASVTVISPGVVRFVPDPGFNGVAQFRYTVRNSCGDEATATVSIRVNQAPIANPDAASVKSNRAVEIAVLANDSDPDGDTLRVTAVSREVNGTATLVSNGVLFVPTPGVVGTGSFRYTITDPGGLQASAEVTVRIEAVNNAPVANPDSASVVSPNSVTVNVVANDSDPDGDNLYVTALGAVPSGVGSAAISGNRVVFQPSPSFEGIAQFAYTVADGNGGSASSTVSIQVTRENRSPRARNDSSSTVSGQEVTVSVLSNDSDPDGDSLEVLSASLVDGDGVVAVVGGGTAVSFTPSAEYVGTAKITYIVSDGRGGTDSATITIEVGAP